MKTKITSMKRAFILFWHGLTALLVGIANWFTVILGISDRKESKGNRQRNKIVFLVTFVSVLFLKSL